MIIDTHTHSFPDKIAESTIIKLAKAANTIAHTNGTRASLTKSMRNGGVDYSIVVPVATKPAQTENINKFASETNKNIKDTGIFSLGGIHPDNENYREILDDIKAKGLIGIKLHPDYQCTFIDDIRYLRIIDYATEIGLAMVVHAGVDIGLPGVVYCTPDRILNVLKQVQTDKFVLAHMGGWKLWDEVEDKLVGRDVYFDTAVCLEQGIAHLSNEQFIRMVRNHGVDKILFATDSPWGGQKEFVSAINNMELTQEEKSKIFAENAMKVFEGFI